MSVDARGRRDERVVVPILVLSVLLHAAVVVRDIGGPLVAAGDANYFEYLGHYVAGHLRWGLPLRLDFSTDEVAYPFGTNIVFLSWCAERDVLHALLLRSFGPGPWLQLYVAASDALTAFGTYALLRGEVGPRRAAGVAFAASVMAFYAAFKFPLHLNLSALHWASMSIVVDWLFVRRVLARERLSALLVLVRVTLLGLTVGLDIAYVAGFALVSFTTTTAFVVFVCVRDRQSLRALLPEAPLAEVRARPLAFAAWSALLAVACLVYVPFDLAVVLGSRVYAFEGPGGVFWANQLRMLVPFFPGVHPESDLLVSIFGRAEGPGEFSPGWAMLLAGAWGVRDAWAGKRLRAFVPLLLTFGLALAFHPSRLPTLRVFPWFFYNRVAGRGTMFFPLFLGLLALGRDARGRGETTERTRDRRLLVIGAIAAVEIATAYGLVHPWRPVRDRAPILAYMAAVRDAPGKAVLDWPFCIAGANGVGTEELCPYYTKQSTSYAWRRFHGKSVPGFYLSRTHPSQIAPWVSGGWPAMFAPDVPDAHRATRQTRCFDERGWAFFTAFYESGDFAGIQLHVDREAPACLAEFHARFGPPAAEVVLPGVGRTQFLPRRPGTRDRIDEDRARQLRR